jgi:CheY-like chemotaxis protein
MQQHGGKLTSFEAFDSPILEESERTNRSFEPHQILLVDDSKSEAELFQSALKEGSPRAKAFWVATGAEALDYLKRQGRFEGMPAVKIVILDLNLPDQSGFEVLKKIRASPSISRYPVIIFSSSSDSRAVELAYSLGANAYFSKPLSLESYVRKVTSIVRHWLEGAELPV